MQVLLERRKQDLDPIEDVGLKEHLRENMLAKPRRKLSEELAACLPCVIHKTNNRFKNICLSGFPAYLSKGKNSSCQYSSYSFDSYSVFQADCFQHWFKNWQELRKNKLTASTFAGAVGFCPRRRVKLWLEKIGAEKPFSGNEATAWGNIKEEEALERYKLITGNNVLLPNFQVIRSSSPDDWLAASADGIVNDPVYGLRSEGVLEIKCPYFDGYAARAFPWARIPLFCIPQAQGLMEIMDRDWMDFYVWTPNGSSLFRLYRDVEYWEVLKIALSEFWWKHVQPAKELYSRHVIRNPHVELKSLKPAPRHELWGEIVYGSKQIVYDSRLLMREIHGKLVT